jgi:hypothetical protein
LRGEEAERKSEVETRKEVATAVEDKLFAARMKQSAYIEANVTAQSIQEKARNLRGEAHRILADLRTASMALSSSEESIKSIATDLQDAGYARSRREMASRLREIFTKIVGLDGKQNILLDQAAMKSAFDELQKVDQSTAYVLEFANSQS